MSGLVNVLVLGDLAPERYEDFSVMLESSLLPYRRQTVVLYSQACNYVLEAMVKEYALEHQIEHHQNIEPHHLDLAQIIVFLNSAHSRTFSLLNYENKVAKPLVFLLEPPPFILRGRP